MGGPMNRKGRRVVLAWFVLLGLASQADRARADLSQADADKYRKMGAEEWQATITFSDSLSHEWTSPSVEKTNVQASMAADALTFDHVKMGKGKGDLGWSYESERLGVSSSGQGTLSHSVHHPNYDCNESGG